MLYDDEVPTELLIYRQRLCTAFEEALCSVASLRKVLEIELLRQEFVLIVHKGKHPIPIFV